MDPKPESSAPTLPGSGPMSTLPVKAADWVEAVVAALRDKTVRPLTLVTRALVFGTIVLAAAVVAATLLSIALVRLLTVYAFNGRVWLSDLVVGAVFVLIGAWAWSHRRTRGGGPEGVA